MVVQGKDSPFCTARGHWLPRPRMRSGANKTKQTWSSGKPIEYELYSSVWNSSNRKAVLSLKEVVRAIKGFIFLSAKFTELKGI